MGDKRYKIQDTRYKIQDTRYKIQDTRYKISPACQRYKLLFEELFNRKTKGMSS